jgi:hypothetical protein
MFHRDSFRPSDLMVVKRAGRSSLKSPGSFVRLNSGGPLGVVESVDHNDRATVHWLTGDRTQIADVCLTPVCP